MENTEIINLYGEDGIQIGLTADYDICEPQDDDCTVIVIGHPAYAMSLEDAERSIRRAYLDRLSIPTPATGY